MEIKKLNPEGMEAPLVGGVLERDGATSNTDNITMEDEDETSEDELTDGGNETNEDETESAEGQEEEQGPEDEEDENEEHRRSENDIEDVEEKAIHK